MKKISNINWTRYKESENGKQVIARFEALANPDASAEEVYAIAKCFNPELFKNTSKKEENLCLEDIDYCYSLIYSYLNEDNHSEYVEDTHVLYHTLTQLMTTGKTDIPYDDIPQAAIKNVLGLNTFFSIALYSFLPDYFIPNLFVMQFIYLKHIAEKYEIELPEIPNRSDYRKRWSYYLQICDAINEFASQNGIESGAELCAFLFDYELPLAIEELNNEDTQAIPEQTSQAWILVGKYSEGEKNMERGFWQANELTEKGDIMLFVEKSPVSALTSVWIAQENGVKDPFFHYYSNTYIGDRINIPIEQAVKFRDFKESEYFKEREKKGNYVSKNFQDVCGWEVTYDDYQEIQRMLREKGFDTSVLPQLYKPERLREVHLNREGDVSAQLLVPLLEQMGWKRNIDFRDEVEFNAGRGKTGNSIDKRPDFCLHIVETDDDIEAKVAIEAKYFMKNEHEIHENFVQGRSYAKWGAVQVLMLCDQKQIRVYQRDKNNRFIESKFIKFSWADMENPDKYGQLKQILSCK